MRQFTAALVCALVAVIHPATPSVATDEITEATTAATTAVLSKRLSSAIDGLGVAVEARTGYDRDKFQHWVDADGDCQDTRDEVLAAESRTVVRGCDIGRGLWMSAYDGLTARDSAKLDIDHLVPLAEAWDSGARRWNAATRQRFANDLRDPRSLIAVSASSNRSKSDRDPAEWMPQLGRCAYVRQWVAVKTRWQLTVDRAEKRALRRHASGCKDSLLRVRVAIIGTGGATGGGGTSTPSTGAGLDPRFSTCTEAKAHGFGPYVRGRDVEYDWYVDGDSDGVVCE